MSADALARHAEFLFETGEAEGWVISRHGMTTALAKGGLTAVGLKAMLDRSAIEAKTRSSTGHWLRAHLRAFGARLLDLGWKLAAGIALAGALVVLGWS